MDDLCLPSKPLANVFILDIIYLFFYDV